MQNDDPNLNGYCMIIVFNLPDVSSFWSKNVGGEASTLTRPPLRGLLIVKTILERECSAWFTESPVLYQLWLG